MISVNGHLFDDNLDQKISTIINLNLTFILHRIRDIQGFPETIEGRITINRIEATTIEAQTRY